MKGNTNFSYKIYNTTDSKDYGLLSPPKYIGIFFIIFY